jgi:hypothetical protein
MKYKHIFFTILLLLTLFGFEYQTTRVYVVEATVETTFTSEAPLDDMRQRDLTKQIKQLDKKTFGEFVNSFVVRLGQIAVRVLISLALFTFLWGLMKYIYKGQESDAARTDGRKLMLWGLIGLFVMTSVWGLVAILSGVVDAPVATPQFNVGSSSDGKDDAD